MTHLIDKDALVAEIESKIEKYTKRGEDSDAKRDGYGMYWGGVLSCLNEVRTLCDAIEVKEVEENRLPNPCFPHLNNIIDKVFGTANLESFEYEEAEQLVLLAKGELLKDLEVKEVDLEKEIDWVWNKTSDNFLEDGWKEFENIAKHFFELGIKAQKGE